MPQWRYIERKIKDWGAVVLFFPSPLIWKGKKSRRVAMKVIKDRENKYFRGW